MERQCWRRSGAATAGKEVFLAIYRGMMSSHHSSIRPPSLPPSLNHYSLPSSSQFSTFGHHLLSFDLFPVVHLSYFLFLRTSFPGCACSCFTTSSSLLFSPPQEPPPAPVTTPGPGEARHILTVCLKVCRILNGCDPGPCYG